MSDASTGVLLTTAMSIAFVHTLIGVDHTLPFVVLARAQRWSLGRLWAVTGVCGLGHVLSSILLGAVGIGFGVAVQQLEWIDSVRGGIASRLLIGFGLAYAAWAIWRTIRGRQHTHAHVHEDGTVHTHEHGHEREHAHLHTGDQKAGGARGKPLVTVATMFIVLVLGPCEALIPLLMAPAFDKHWLVIVAVASVFAAVTVGTMLAVVTFGYLGLRWRGAALLERHVHAIAGITIAMSGVAIELLHHHPH